MAIIKASEIRDKYENNPARILGLVSEDLPKELEKPVILAVNKVDDERHEPEAHQFARLGYGEPLSISA